MAKTKNQLTVDLRDLEKEQHPGLTSRCGGFLCESASACFVANDKPAQFRLAIRGDVSERVSIIRAANSKRLRDTYNDLEDATHHGAYGVAIALMRVLLGYSVITRSKKGTGFDYWVRKDKAPKASIPALVLSDVARLEVSGILKQKRGELERRTKQKLKQSSPSDATGLSAIAAVVEFETPEAMIRTREP